MNAKNQTKTCQHCGLAKSQHAFIIGRNTLGEPLYSNVCDDCRQQSFLDDDDESGGKKRRLGIDHENRDKQIINQQEHEDKVTEEKESYFEELEESAESYLDDKKSADKTRTQVADRSAQKTKKAFGLFSGQDKQTPAKTGRDLHLNGLVDPMKEGPITDLGDTTYNANPDRNDVKLARQNIDPQHAGRHGNLPGHLKTKMFSPNKQNTKETAASAKENANMVVSLIKNTWGKR